MNAPWLYTLIFSVAVLASNGIPHRFSREARPTALSAVETWTIPGAGRTAGQNNTQFVSDLALTNLGIATANVTISFVGPGGLPAKPIAIAAGATTAYRNILDALWSATGLVGALSVHADQPLVLRARTYNTAATGTFGVALPVYASGQLLAEGETAHSIWVQQSPSGNTGFRTNVGVVFPDVAGGEAVVTFYDAAGAEVGFLNYSSPTPGFQQLSTSSIAPTGLPIGRAQISVIRGHAAGYAVGVDNVTGDTSLYPLEALPAGVQDVVVSGVARLNGRNNTFFRTDARLYNPTPDDASVTVRYLAGGSANPTPPSAALTVPAGRVLEVVDLLGSILNLPVGSGGAVRFTADQSVAILARTSNVDPQGVQPGTFGAQQHPVPLASYLSSADAGAVVTAIRQDTAFRTNIGFAAGPDGAAYNLALKDSHGGVSAVTTGALGAFGWAQPSIADLFPGTTIPADASVLVQVTQGTVAVYDASLDNASGDLVITPIAPVPAALPSSASIGPSGGSIRSADGRLTLKVPAGALAAPTTLSIAPTANGAPNAIGSGYALSPVSTQFAAPAQLVLAYTNADLDGTGTSALGIASDDGSSWQAILGGSLDAVARTLTVSISSSSPSPAATAGRHPQSTFARGNLGPYGSVHIEPKSAVVPVRGRVTLSLTFVGPSSTSTSSRGFFALGPGGGVQVDDIQWSVAGDFLPNPPHGTISGTAGFDAVYTAPNCKPSINPVSVGASVRASGGGHFPNIANVDARVRIVERDWRIEVTYRSQSLCGLSAVWSLEFTRSHDGAFSLDDDGHVIDFLAGLTRNQTTTPAWCPGIDPAGCTQPALASPIGDLNVNDVTGRLVADGLIGDYFDLAVTVQVPGTGAEITWTCPSTPPTTFHFPVFHGAPPTAAQEILVRFPALDETLQFVYPSTIESARVKLTPIRPSSCP